MDKVLVYTLSENIGGIEEYVLNLSRYNIEKKCEYEYVVLGDYTPYKSEMDKLGLKYYFIPKKKKLIENVKQISKCFRKCRKECEILYFNTSTLCYPLPYLLAKKYDYKIVLHSHLTGTTGIRKYIHCFNRSWIRKICSVKLACSTPAAEWMFGQKYINDVTIIPNAIKLKRFQYNPKTRIKRRHALGINDEIVIGHVGRLSESKNQSFLLDIILEAKKQNLNYKLLLVGDGEDEQMLKNKANKLHITDRVIFSGQSNQPEEFMDCMDCFVMPSLVEGFPITLVEAQASGLPCIVADTVTNEINISGQILFKSLNNSAKEWLDVIKKHNLIRYECLDVLNKNGYNVFDIEKTVYSVLFK